MNSEKYQKCLEDREIILRVGYKKHIDKMPTKADIEKAFTTGDENAQNKVANSLEDYRKKAVERAECIEKIKNISKKYRNYNYIDRAKKIEEKDLNTMSLSRLKILANTAEFNKNVYFRVTGTTPEKTNLIRKKQELKQLKNPYKEAIKYEKKKTRKKKIGNFVVGFCGVALALNGGFLIGVGGVIAGYAVIKNIADNYDLRKLRKQTRNYRKDNRERISALELEIEQEEKGLAKSKGKTKTKSVEVKTASPEAKVETVAPKVDTKEVAKAAPVAESEVEELVEGLTEEKKVTEEKPAEVITEATEVIEEPKKEESQVDELGVPLDTKKKEVVEEEPKKQETTFISSDNKKEEEVIAELAKAAANDTTAIANLRGVDLSTRFLKSQRDITEYYLYKQYGQEPTSVTVKALIDVEKSMDLLEDNTKSNTRSM